MYKHRIETCWLSPLALVAWHGHDGIVRLLLERDDVSVESLDNSGQTPLSLAARKGHVGVVSWKLLAQLVVMHP